MTDRSLRIGIVAPYDLSEPGGVTHQIRGQARALRHLGHDVDVYGPASSPLVARPQRLCDAQRDQDGPWRRSSRPSPTRISRRTFRRRMSSAHPRSAVRVSASSFWKRWRARSRSSQAASRAMRRLLAAHSAPGWSRPAMLRNCRKNWCGCSRAKTTGEVWANGARHSCATTTGARLPGDWKRLIGGCAKPNHVQRRGRGGRRENLPQGFLGVLCELCVQTSRFSRYYGLSSWPYFWRPRNDWVQTRLFSMRYDQLFTHSVNRVGFTSEAGGGVPGRSRPGNASLVAATLGVRASTITE